MEGAKLFLVAKVVAETDKGRVWEFCGIFDSRDLAIAACLDWHFCICPVTLNERWPEESIEFPDCEYPILRTPEEFAQSSDL